MFGRFLVAALGNLPRTNGAYIGAEALPEAWVETTLERNRPVGIDPEALTERLMTAIERRRE